MENHKENEAFPLQYEYLDEVTGGVYPTASEGIYIPAPAVHICVDYRSSISGNQKACCIHCVNYMGNNICGKK